MTNELEIYAEADQSTTDSVKLPGKRQILRKHYVSFIIKLIENTDTDVDLLLLNVSRKCLLYIDWFHSLCMSICLNTSAVSARVSSPVFLLCLWYICSQCCV